MTYKNNAHSVCNIRYHIIWCTKYRYKILTKEIANRLNTILNIIADANKIEIIEGSINIDHVHLLIECPTTLSPAQIAQYFKGNSSKQLMLEFKTLKQRYYGKHIWSRGYFIATVGSITDSMVQNYINSQGEEWNTISHNNIKIDLE